MQNKELIEQRLDELKREYGEWSYDIPLSFDLWTRGNLKIPHTRLKRIFQVVSDFVQKPLSECRILDLGCLDGLFSIEFALHGARTIGVEIREANIKKAIFCQEVLGLHNLEFRKDDVRNISSEVYGKFDAIICSGILYHLPALDAIKLINSMHEMVTGVLVIDTHVALAPEELFRHNDNEYWGSTYREFPDDTSAEVIAKSLWASADNPTSFWFTRPSMINLLSESGFSSVYECFTPAHLNFGKSGIERKDRCTFVAIKGKISQIKTSPTVNNLVEKFPEQSLAYSPDNTNQDQESTILAEKERAEKLLAEIQNSRAWKLISFIRRIRSKLHLSI